MQERMEDRCRIDVLSLGLVSVGVTQSLFSYLRYGKLKIEPLETILDVIQGKQLKNYITACLFEELFEQKGRKREPITSYEEVERYACFSMNERESSDERKEYSQELLEFFGRLNERCIYEMRYPRSGAPKGIRELLSKS